MTDTTATIARIDASEGFWALCIDCGESSLVSIDRAARDAWDHECDASDAAYAARELTAANAACAAAFAAVHAAARGEDALAGRELTASQRRELTAASAAYQVALAAVHAAREQAANG